LIYLRWFFRRWYIKTEWAQEAPSLVGVGEVLLAAKDEAVRVVAAEVDAAIDDFFTALGVADSVDLVATVSAVCQLVEPVAHHSASS
jgi:hypothetical protein